MQSIVTGDSSSSDVLFFGKSRSFYVYAVGRDVWTLQEAKLPIFEPTRVADSKIWHVTAAPLSTYGVIMFVKYLLADQPRAWVYFYRHSAAKLGQTG